MVGADQKRRRRLVTPALATAACLAIVAPGSAGAYTVRGLTTDVPSRIASFSSQAPQTVDLEPIGFPPATTDTDLVGLAYRHSSGDLYAIGSGGTVYVLTGAGPFAAVPLGPTPAADPLASSNIGFAIDPTTELLRVLGGPTENLSFEPLNGSQVGGSPTLAYSSTTASGAADPNAGKSPRLVAAAYSDPGFADNGTLWVIDMATNSLSTLSVDPAAPGTLYTAGELTLKSLTDVAGLDVPIGADVLHSNLGLLAIQKAGSAGSEICRLALHDVITAKIGLSEKAGDARSCTGIAAPPIESIAIVPYSAVRFEGGEAAVFETTEGPVQPSAGTGPTARIPVVRSGDLRRRIVVPWAAVRRTSAEFTGLSGTVTFEPGKSQALLPLTVPGNVTVDRVRRITLGFGADGDDWVAAPPATATVRVVDNDIGVRFLKRKRPSLRRVLRSHALRAPYKCTRRCRFSAKLRLNRALHGDVLAKARGESDAAGHLVVVFSLGRGARAAMRSGAGARGLKLWVQVGFDSSWGASEHSLRPVVLPP